MGDANKMHARAEKDDGRFACPMLSLAILWVKNVAFAKKNNDPNNIKENEKGSFID